MRRARHSRGRSSAGAVLLIVTLAIGQLGAFLHASSAHERCAEHGELVHGDGDDQAEGAARGLAVWLAEQSRTGGGDEVRGLPEAAGHEHDHCLATCASRERVTAPDAPGALAARAAARDASAVAHVERAAARAIYRTAPKTSPPA